MENEFSPIRSPGRWRSRARVSAGAAGLAMVALALSACTGGASTPGIASVGSTTTTTASGGTGGASGTGGLGKGPNRNSLLKFSKCMQSHGLPDFPEPNATGDLQISGGPNSDMNPNNPIFQKAQAACQKYGPGGSLTPAQKAEALKQGLKMAECMRAHGITDFPDPSSTGAIKINGGPNSDMNPSNPIFQKAQSACGTTKGGKGGPGIRIGFSGGGPPPGASTGGGTSVGVAGGGTSGSSTK